MLRLISFFSFNLEVTNVKKSRAVTFDEFLFITKLIGILTQKYILSIKMLDDVFMLKK